MASKNADQCCKRDSDEKLDVDESAADYSVEETNKKGDSA